MRTFRYLAAALVLSSLAAGAGVARADGPQAVATAAQHAGLAAGQDNLNGVRRHLHHALNCLVGPDGKDFDESAGNPCASAGGAIPQTADPDMKAKLEKIAMQIHDGVMDEDLGKAKALAADVQKMLAAE
jgi:hypothetical protein